MATWICRMVLLTTYELRRRGIMLSGRAGMTAFEFFGPADALCAAIEGGLATTEGLPSATFEQVVLIRSSAGQSSGF
jgi:hypothetical protein